MGGAKKKSFSQTERQQSLKSGKESSGSKSAKTKFSEKKVRGIEIPIIPNQEISDELAKMKIITPHLLAQKHNIKLSTAKKWLNTLEERGVVQVVASGNSLKIYKFRR